MHGIHGRAPALATGLATAREDLSIWVDHRRRRLAFDRRQPSDPRAQAQRAGQDPAVQQPDLRPHEGPGIADVRGRQDHEVDAVRRRRSPVQPGGARARGRGDVRRAHDRPRPASSDRRAARRGDARGRRARRGLPELPGVQRRRVRRADRQERQGRKPDPTRGRPVDPLRRRERARRCDVIGRHAATSSKSPRLARTDCSSTTRTGPTPVSRSRWLGSPKIRPDRRRSASSATSGGTSMAAPASFPTTPRPTRNSASCSTAARSGRSRSGRAGGGHPQRTGEIYAKRPTSAPAAAFTHHIFRRPRRMVETQSRVAPPDADVLGNSMRPPRSGGLIAFKVKGPRENYCRF